MPQKITPRQEKFSGAMVAGSGASHAAGGYNTLVFGATQYDTNSYISGNTFVVPATGYYDIGGVLGVLSAAAQRAIYVVNYGAVSTYELFDNNIEGADTTIAGHLSGVYLTAGQTVSFGLYLVVSAVTISTGSRFYCNFRGAA